MALGQLMLDLEGLELTAVERELLQHPQVGGVILFSRNYQSPEQLMQLVKTIRLATSRRLLIAVDQEGGRVQRFKTGFTTLPPMQQFGKLYEQDPAKAKAWAHNAGWLMAAELLAFDIDFSFAPVLDLDRGVSEVIGDRSFHSSPEVVATLGAAICAGIQEAGMATVGKHFPGHGSVAVDSHIALPIDERDYQTIAELDMIPFQRLASQLDGIMPAHIIYRQADPMPAGFSSFWLQSVLRQQLKFQGTIFSDDLVMAGAAIAGNFAERADKALKAGCDMVLVCNNRDAAIAVIDALGDNIDLTSQQRLLKMQAKVKANLTATHPERWQQAVKQIETLMV